MFTFSFPQALWGLLGILLLLRWRFFHRKTYVSSLEIWNSIPKNVLHQRKKWHSLWSVLLAIIIYFLLVVTLAKPNTFSDVRHMTIVLDCSASMTTVDKTQMVFDKAVASIKKMLLQLSKHDRLTLITYPLQQKYHGNPQQINSILNRCHPCHMEGDPEALLRSLNDKKIFFFTDGTLRNSSNSNIVQISVGVPGTNNLGITKFFIERIEKDNYALFITLQNFSTIVRSTDLWIWSDQTKIHTEQITISGLSSISWTTKVILKDASLLKLELSKKDNFLLDNIVYAVKNPPLTLWADKKSQNILKQLLFIPGVKEVSRSLEADVHFRSHSDKISKSAITVLINGAIFPEFKKGDILENPKLMFYSHAVMEAVYPELIKISRAQTIRAKNCQPLIADVKGIVLGIGKNYLYIGFDIENTNWYHLPSYPVFWWNYFQSIAPYRGTFSYSTTNSLFPQVGFHKKSAYNLLSVVESKNIGESSGDVKQQLKEKYPPGISLQNILLLVIYTVLLVLWWKENARRA